VDDWNLDHLGHKNAKGDRAEDESGKTQVRDIDYTERSKEKIASRPTTGRSYRG
jgi:hypothetical protein